nr:O-antigen ligase family protein [Anaerolineales bacterium]
MIYRLIRPSREVLPGLLLFGLVVGVGVVAAVNPPGALLLAGAPLGLWLLVRLARSSHALIFLALAWGLLKSLPMLDILNEDARVSVLGRPISTVGVTLLMLAGLVVIRSGWVLLAKRQASLRKQPLLIFFFYSALSLLWGTEAAFTAGIRWIGYLTILTGVYVLTLEKADDLSTAGRLSREIMLVLTLFATISLISGREFTASQDLRGERLIGIAGSPNILAGALTMLLAPCLGIVLTKGLGRAERWLAWLGLGLGGLALYFSFSRSGWVGIAVAVVVALAVKRRWPWLAVLTSVAGVTLLGVSLLEVRVGFIGNLTTFLNNPFDVDLAGWETATTRLVLWRDALTDLAQGAAVMVGGGAGTVNTW